MDLNPEQFACLRELLLNKSGIDLKTGKEYLLVTRLQPILSDLGILSFNSLCEKLHRGEDRTLQKVIDAMTTNETLWFRDQSFFSSMERAVLPALLQRSQQEKIYLWSAASSTGQEAYSLAIMILELLKKMGKPPQTLPNVIILATDLSSQVLEQAKTGRYNTFAIARGMPETLLTSYFIRKDEEYELIPMVRSMVKFEPFNLLDSFAKKGPFHLVLCRNVLIYFPDETKKQICLKIQSVLHKDGILALGSTETLWSQEYGFERQVIANYPFYRPLASKTVVAPQCRLEQGNDKRQFIRLPLRLKAALILDNGQQVTGMTHDISIGGTFFALSMPTPKEWAQKFCQLTLFLSSGAAKKEIVIKSRIVRVTQSGAGIRFVSISLEEYQELKNVLVYNSVNPEVLLAQLAKNTGMFIRK